MLRKQKCPLCGAQADQFSLETTVGLQTMHQKLHNFIGKLHELLGNLEIGGNQSQIGPLLYQEQPKEGVDFKVKSSVSTQEATTQTGRHLFNLIFSDASPFCLSLTFQSFLCLFRKKYKLFWKVIKLLRN